MSTSTRCKSEWRPQTESTEVKESAPRVQQQIVIICPCFSWSAPVFHYLPLFSLSTSWSAPVFMICPCFHDPPLFSLSVPDYLPLLFAQQTLKHDGGLVAVVVAAGHTDQGGSMLLLPVPVSRTSSSIHFLFLTKVWALCFRDRHWHSKNKSPCGGISLTTCLKLQRPTLTLEEQKPRWWYWWWSHVCCFRDRHWHSKNKSPWWWY